MTDKEKTEMSDNLAKEMSALHDDQKSKSAGAKIKKGFKTGGKLIKDVATQPGKDLAKKAKKAKVKNKLWDTVINAGIMAFVVTVGATGTSKALGWN